ncbi:MAG: porin [Campylobacterales bacterium]|nr:porin [Campylobacterales bacterium]
MTPSKLSLALITALAFSGSIYADDASEIAQLKKEMKELRAMTQTLVEETSDLKTGSSYTTVDTEKSYSGLGSAASKVYYSKSPLSIGGYGEVMYTNNNDSSKGSTLAGTKFVPYIGYKFSDNIILNTEIEFEGGGVDRGGNAGDEVVVEFMYLDYLINKNVNIRAGNFIIPMGLINQKHEPTLYNTVERPDTEKYIIPSTWTETGAMAYGNIINNLTYNFAAVSALKTNVNGKEWIREGRGGPVERSNPNLGFAARLDYTGINGLLVGASAYYGPSTDGVKSDTSIYDIHLDYKNSGARVYGVYSQATRSSASNIATDAVKSAQGGYINLSYDILSLTSSTYSLPLFVQYESLNAEEKRADGTSGDSTQTTTMGVNFFPHEQVVLKLNYAMKSQGTIDDQITNVSMGFIF